MTVVVVLIAVFFGRDQIAKANPLYFTPTVQTATATTSPSLLQAATATTTVLYYDSYAGGTITRSGDSALLVQFAATSTSAILNLSREYSQGFAGVNCVTTPLACDWYADSLSVSSTGFPSPVITLSNIYTWGVPAAATSSRIMALPIPTRYVRINAKLAGAPGSVWAQIVPTKEQSER